MTQPADELQQRVQGRDFKLYAEFGRKRGGLLYVLQAALIIAQSYLVVAVGEVRALWAPALLLPLFLMYFLLRNRVWRHFYRRQGDLDQVAARAEARRSLRISLPFSAALGIVLALNRGWVVAAVAGLWMALPWLVVALRGRLPVDTLVCTFTAVTGHNMLVGAQITGAPITTWLLIGIGISLTAYGLYEHWLFWRSHRQGAKTP